MNSWMMLAKHKKKLIYLGVIIFFIFLYFWTDPTPNTKGTIKIYDNSKNLIYESSGFIGHQEPVSISKVPKSLIDAVIITEDKRFRYHLGADPIAIVRAIYQDILQRKIVSGASTIPMQLARYTVISPQNTYPINVFRKLREILIATRLSVFTSKEKVLEQYLNSMHFGRQTYGIASASRLYFGKNVENLSIAESALLAGMISNPSQFDPVRYPENSKRHRNEIIKKLYNSELITKESLDRAINEPLPISVNTFEVISPHAVQMVLSEVKSLNIKSDGGLSVFTTLDSGWYSLTRLVSVNQVKKLSLEHDLSNASVVIIKNSTGEIVTILGSIDYFDENIGGQNNMALALRQPGSALKPLTYAAAFEDKIATPGTPIDDSPKVYLTNKGEGFMPHNYDGRYRGVVLARESLASSYNLPAVEILSRIGISRFLDLAHKMGITSMQETDRYDLALTLGGGEVNLIELTNLYATFARGGVYLSTNIINKVEDKDGKTVYQQKDKEEKRVLSEETSFLITDILSDKKARIPTFGEKNALVVSAPAAVKTGTTTDWHDNWTIGYTPDYTVGVWVGNADNHPMRNITGITGAAPIWHEIISNIIKYRNQINFIKPIGIIDREICAWDGLLPTDRCASKYIEKFIEGTEPYSYSTLTKQPLYLNSSPIQIISPVESTTYELGTMSNEKINFELTRYDNAENISWFLDGIKLSRSECGNEKYICHWTPKIGKHILKAEIEPTLQEVSAVRFSVLEYKNGW